MKTLIVKYLPSANNSNTKKLLDIFKENVTSEIEELDLLKTNLPFFNEKSIAAYEKRNYMGQTLNEEESQLLAQNDALVKQLKAADILVMAFPMHNFGMPALVKAWLDSVVIKGETFDYQKKLMAGKKALILYTSGGIYSHDTFNFDYPNWNSIALMAAANFSFMGFDEHKIIGSSLRDESSESSSPNQTKRSGNLAKLESQIKEVVSQYY